MTTIKLNTRCEDLLTWLHEYGKEYETTSEILSRSSSTISPNGSYYTHYDDDQLNLCRNDLIKLEENGFVKRRQYLNKTIYWTVIK